MLTLVFPKTTLTSASIPVRWCIDEETLSTIDLTGLKPFIIFKIKYNKGFPSEYRLFPLDQFSTYLDIHHSGSVIIQAFIVTAEYNNKNAIRKAFMSSSYEREHLISFSEYWIDINPKKSDPCINVTTYNDSETHVFEVSSELFGKELPEWVKFYINRYWYENKPVDECAQRRRILLFPFTVLPILICEFILHMLWNIGGCLWYWSVLFGASPKHLIHPFDNFINQHDVRRMPIFYEWVHKQKWYEPYKDSLIIPIGLAPICIPLMYIVFYIISLTIGYSAQESLYMNIVVYYEVVLCVTLFVVLIVFPIIWIKEHIPTYIADSVSYIVDKIVRFMDKMDNLYVSKPDKIERTRELLLCHDKDGECLPEIKLKDKSVTLIFADIKNKVCRPMRG